MVTSNGTPPPLIPQFYAERSVLVTGATGFMGKVLVERLLTTCPDIGRIHLLMRGKRNDTAEKRFQNLKDSLIFSRLRERNSSALDKLQLLEGDIVKPNLGLSESDIEGLKDVSIVFHSAAVVRFDDPLVLAVQQNVRSVLRVIQLCDSLPNLQAFMYVSTAYSNAELRVVEERVYPAPVPLADALALTDPLPADVSDRYISPKPNTYTFSKSLAEAAVLERGCDKYPIGIFRPTMVVSALKHPLPGWVESLGGPCGVVMAAGKGALHVFGGDRRSRLDMLPVDLAIDTLIAAAWETAIDRLPEVRVYNCSTGCNPITLGEFEDHLRKVSREHPFDDVLWYPSGFSVKSEFAQKCWLFLLNTIPLYLADYLCMILGIKTRLSYRILSHRIQGLNKVLNFFANRDWVFVRDNVAKLQQRLSPQDAAIFNLDPMSINWEEHMTNFVIGVRRYQLNEKDEAIPQAKRHMRKMRLIHYAVLLLSLVAILRLLMTFAPVSDLVFGGVRVLHSLYSAVVGRIVA